MIFFRCFLCKEGKNLHKTTIFEGIWRTRRYHKKCLIEALRRPLELSSWQLGIAIRIARLLQKAKSERNDQLWQARVLYKDNFRKEEK